MISFPLSIVKEANDKSRLTTYFGTTAFSQDKTLPRKGQRSLTSNGPVGTIIHVPSSRHPDKAEQIKLFFLPAVTPRAPGPTAAVPSQIVVVRPARDDGKEVEAKQGQAKLALFNIGAMLDFEANAISNIKDGINLASMDNIYADQRLARPGMITDLMNTAFIQARK